MDDALSALASHVAEKLGDRIQRADTAYGEPGDPKKPARIVQIAMTESDGRMLFIPDKVEVRRGEHTGLRSPVRLLGTPGQPGEAPPRFAEHAHEILSRLGFSGEELRELQASGAAPGLVLAGVRHALT